MTDRLLKLPQVLEIIPVSKSTWYKKVKSGEFPPPVSFGGSSRFWRLSDIQGLIQGGMNPDTAPKRDSTPA